MGIFNKIFGGADGVKESVNESYVKKFNFYKNLGNDLEYSHRMAIISVLGIRYAWQFNKQSETFLAVETEPFLCIENKEEAANVLAEYILFKENPNICNCTWLAKKFNQILEKNPEKGVDGVKTQMDWVLLLDVAIIQKIKSINK